MKASNKESGDKLEYERADLVTGGLDGAATRKALEWLSHELQPITPRSFSAKRLRRALSEYAEEPGANPKALEQTLRVAITGSSGMDASDIYSAMAHLGKERTLRRIEHAIGQLMVTASV
jgi:hypothetical protein